MAITQPVPPKKDASPKGECQSIQGVLATIWVSRKISFCHTRH